MSRRSLKEFVQEPLTALSAMAGAALLALTLGTADRPAAVSTHAVAHASGPAAGDLRSGPAPRLEVFALPDLQGLARQGAECERAKLHEASAGYGFILRPGA